MTRIVAATAMAAAIALLPAFHAQAVAQTPGMFTLGVSGSGSGFGSIRSTPSGVDCAVTQGLMCYQYFPANSLVVLSAVPDADSVLAAWGGACSGSGPCQVAMDANKIVTATINARPGTNYLVVSTSSIDSVGQGGVTSSPAGLSCAPNSSCRANFPSSSVVTLIPSPTPGSALSAWSGACTGTGACRMSMDTKRTVYAKFGVESPDTLNFTGLWWVPTESGWGINLNHQGNTIFATLFTYDRSGSPVWLVMSGGQRMGPTFYYEGDLYRTTGSAFNAAPFVPITDANITKVGRMWLSFMDFDRADLGYFFDGVWVTKSIRKQIFGTRAANCSSTSASRTAARNFQDLWWNPNESGWGINLTHQDDILFATLFTYDQTGRGLWLVASGAMRQSDGSYFGDLYRTRGPSFDAKPFTPIGPGDIAIVGSVRLWFGDGDDGTLVYTYNGATVTKPITRQVFASTPPMCN